MHLDGPRPRATVGELVMRSGKTMARPPPKSDGCTQAKRAGPDNKAGPKASGMEKAGK